MNFKVGQKVVRIKLPQRTYVNLPRRDIGDYTEAGVIYEVRWIGMQSFLQPDGTHADEPACKLVGVSRVTQSLTNPGDVKTDFPWGQQLFRPLQEEEKKESAAMTIFRNIAANPKIEIPEDA